MTTTNLISEEIGARINDLCRVISAHDHAYYVLNRPSITDEDYDQLYRELVELEKANPGLKNPNSPTTRVGSDLESDFKKISHSAPMLSLEKAFSAEEIVGHFVRVLGNEFDPDTGVVVEPKIDGLSLALRYEDGQLTMAMTRGDGTVGDDVTDNARTIKSIPIIINADPKIGQISTTFEVRGEVCMSRSTFSELNEERLEAGQDAFANPRNAAAGTLKLKDSKEVAKRKLSFVAYSISWANGTSFETHNAVLGMLSLLGFVVPKTKASNLDPDNLDEIIREQVEKRACYPYDIDGLVVKIDSVKMQRELGIGTTTPRWAVAYKFPAERKVSKLLAIDLTVGRTGQITPNARIAPVQIAGTIVKNASLSNIDEIQRMKIDVGDDVIVQKAGEIIPQVIGFQIANTQFIEGRSCEVLYKSTWTMPEVCPSCGMPISRDGVHYFCTNLSCKERSVQYLIYALGKGCLDCDGIGEAQARVLVENGYTTILSLLQIPEEVIPTLFKASAAKKFLKERERFKKAPLWRKLKAMGIDGIGTTTAKELATRWASLADIADNADKLPEAIGPVNAKSLMGWIESCIDEIEKLQSCGFVFFEERKTGPLTGKVFCITGAMASGPREFVASQIEEAGGSVKDSVGRKVQYLVSGDGGGRNKAEAAKKYGTQVITEVELYSMIGIEMPVGGGAKSLCRELIED